KKKVLHRYDYQITLSTVKYLTPKYFNINSLISFDSVSSVYLLNL
ncbi:hypothetical protein ISN45_Aa07g032160, partial [Arabidopsis thaliana x Arabidopsis arenosa]